MNRNSLFIGILAFMLSVGIVGAIAGNHDLSLSRAALGTGGEASMDMSMSGGGSSSTGTQYCCINGFCSVAGAGVCGTNPVFVDLLSCTPMCMPASASSAINSSTASNGSMNSSSSSASSIDSATSSTMSIWYCCHGYESPNCIAQNHPGHDGTCPDQLPIFASQLQCNQQCPGPLGSSATSSVASISSTTSGSSGCSASSSSSKGRYCCNPNIAEGTPWICMDNSQFGNQGYCAQSTNFYDDSQTCVLQCPKSSSVGSVVSSSGTSSSGGSASSSSTSTWYCCHGYGDPNCISQDHPGHDGTCPDQLPIYASQLQCNQQCPGPLSAASSSVFVTPPLCGNGLRESPEQCDDGDRVGGDGCSPTCTIENGYDCRLMP